MSKKYYGVLDSEYYVSETLEEAFEDIKDCYEAGFWGYPVDGGYIGMIIEEMKPFIRQSRYCIEKNVFIESDGSCGKFCDRYIPNNGKSDTCKYSKCSLVPTGRKWEIVGDYEFRRIK